MASFKQKRLRLEALETAYNAVQYERDSIGRTYESFTDEEGKTDYKRVDKTIEQLSDEDRDRWLAYDNFMKELDKLA